MRTILVDPPEIEYLHGKPYPKVSPKLTHSLVQMAVARILDRCGAGRGKVAPELRVRLEAGTEFVPDVAWVSTQRLRALAPVDREEPPFAPDIAVEVRSPSNRRAYDAPKFAEYLHHGALLVLDVDPSKRTIHAHAPGIRSATYRASDSFSHPAVPWLCFPVSELFSDLLD